jgi:hypothetical protein
VFLVWQLYGFAALAGMAQDFTVCAQLEALQLSSWIVHHAQQHWGNIGVQREFVRAIGRLAGECRNRHKHGQHMIRSEGLKHDSSKLRTAW